MFTWLLHGLPCQIDVWLHVAAGSVALGTFWTAAAVRKGGQLHRKAGKFFMLAMCAILATGVLLVVRRFADGELTAGTYLAYLFFITGQTCWLAWRSVQDKADWRVMVAPPSWQLWMWSSLLAGVTSFSLGMRAGDPVLIGFSLIGPALFFRTRCFARRGPTRSNWHVVQHYQSIFGAGIATHVAFLSVGMSHVWPLLSRIWPTLPPALICTFPWYAPGNSGNDCAGRAQPPLWQQGACAGACPSGKRNFSDRCRAEPESSHGARAACRERPRE